MTHFPHPTQKSINHKEINHKEICNEEEASKLGIILDHITKPQTHEYKNNSQIHDTCWVIC
jgi:hypothetical protein